MIYMYDFFTFPPCVWSLLLGGKTAQSLYCPSAVLYSHRRTGLESRGSGFQISGGTRGLEPSVPAVASYNGP